VVKVQCEWFVRVNIRPLELNKLSASLDLDVCVREKLKIMVSSRASVQDATNILIPGPKEVKVGKCKGAAVRDSFLFTCSGCDI
jgi:hypothetical protein